LYELEDDRFDDGLELGGVVVELGVLLGAGTSHVDIPHEFIVDLVCLEEVVED